MSTKRIKLALGLFLVAGAVGDARASREGVTPLPKLFGDPKGSESDDAKARDAIKEIEKACSYSPFSRRGPSPETVARCNSAEDAALRLGATAAWAALRSLDRDQPYMAASGRLYDVVARAGDVAMVETLVNGLERSLAPDAGDRAHEAYSIDLTLRRITFASVGESAPWQSPSSVSIGAAPWRTWLAAHNDHKMSRDALLAERSTEARVAINGADLDEAFLAAQFLAAEPSSRAEGLAALHALAKRDGLTDVQRRAIHYAIEAVPKAPPQKPAIANGEPRV